MFIFETNTGTLMVEKRRAAAGQKETRDRLGFFLPVCWQFSL